MKTILKLLLVGMLLLSVAAMSACSIRFGPKDRDDETENSYNGGDEQEEDDEEDENDPTETPVSTEADDTDTPAPTPVADPFQDVVEVGWEDTIGPATDISDLDQYNINKRLLGLIDDSNPHGIEDHINGIIVAGDIFVLNQRFKDEIYSGIHIGESFDDIRKILGQPGWETDSILLYRNWNYYILFQGNGVAQYAVLAKAPDTQYDKYILSNIISVLNSDDYTSLEESLKKIDPDETFFENSGFINGGGYYAASRRGILITDFDEKYVEVYNNYQGNLFDHTATNPRYEVRFIDRDMTIDSMLADFNSFLEIEELFKNEGVVSPDGKLSAVFEWVYSMDQHFIVRTLDNSIQDRYIYAATLSEFHWLTNSHLVYIDAYNELPYAIDVDFSDPSSINILYEAGVIKEKDVDAGKYKFEILGVKNSILSLKDTLNNKTYNIQIVEGANGEITFKPQ